MIDGGYVSALKAVATNEGTDPGILFAVGAIGVAGTLLGAFVSDLLSRKREKRAALARQSRAVTAVVGELLDAASILDTAKRRQAWWPPLDSPRDRAWTTYSDDLAELLDEEQWNRVRMTYETHRSLNALRDAPNSDAPPSSSPKEQLQWNQRWPEAASATEDSLTATWNALSMLRALRE